jgi:hypothetical protein
MHKGSAATSFDTGAYPKFKIVAVRLVRRQPIHQKESS